MPLYYYRLHQNQLVDGRLATIKEGIYEGYYEVHLSPDGVEDPSSIPIQLDRRIPWEERQRNDILRGTTVSIGFPSGDQTYEAISDWDTVDGHLIILAELGTWRHADV